MQDLYYHGRAWDIALFTAENWLCFLWKRITHIDSSPGKVGLGVPGKGMASGLKNNQEMKQEGDRA